MCGICGAVFTDRNYVLPEDVMLTMRDVLTHRGPDDAGHYINPGIALGSRRLAILDLSTHGHMPMSTQDGRFWITYNGEVYNFQELRAFLEGKGVTFVSNTDTEVVLKLYAFEGPAMLERLNGMFAIAIWDKNERTLFLGRDRLGVKPLYYYEKKEGLLFASEAKALFVNGVHRSFDHDKLEELLCFRYIAGEDTSYVGVKRLLAGHYMLWKDGQKKIRRWWNLAERAKAKRENLPKNIEGWFEETFDSSVDLRRISDVNVGVLLSGGLDSGSVAASLADQTNSKIASFTIRFKESKYDEGPLAKRLANRWGLEPHELWVSPDELLLRLQTASRLNDEPLTHGNDLYILAIAQYAKSFVTVLLSGEGGDETLGGYVRYQPLHYPALLALSKPILPRLSSSGILNTRMRKLARFLSLGTTEQFILYNACEVLPSDLESAGMNPSKQFPFREQVLEEAQSIYPTDHVRQAMYSDHHTFLSSILDRNDRMTMGASIECRVPFLDYRLVEMLAALPSKALLNSGRGSKHLLRDAVGHRLPKEILDHKKWGFAVPWSLYLRNSVQLREMVRQLPETEPIKSGPFNQARLKAIVESFLKGDGEFDSFVRQLLMITVWYKTCISNTN